MLCRSPGLPYPASFAVALFDPSTIRDVNGYYAELGLVDSRQRPLASADARAVRAAYRRRMSALHPDRGSWDSDPWERAQCAWECLSVSAYRAHYDRLRPPMVWMDRRQLRSLPTGELGEEQQARLQALLERPADEEVYAFFFDDEAAIPAPDVVAAWLRLFAYWLYRRGGESTVRVGFTSGTGGVLARRYGTIFMVPREVTPSLYEVARYVHRASVYRGAGECC